MKEPELVFVRHSRTDTPGVRPGRGYRVVLVPCRKFRARISYGFWVRIFVQVA